MLVTKQNGSCDDKSCSSLWKGGASFPCSPHATTATGRKRYFTVVVFFEVKAAARLLLRLSFKQGLGKVVATIIEQRSTMQQRDGQRKTPLQVARQRNQSCVADMLERAGAPDYS